MLFCRITYNGSILAQLATNLGLLFDTQPFLRKQYRLCVSSWIEDLSVNITSSKPSSASSRNYFAQSNLFTLFAARINWQYALPQKVHPSSLRQQNIVQIEMLQPMSHRILCI